MNTAAKAVSPGLLQLAGLVAFALIVFVFA